ncbi:MAG: hypothetical protein PHN49_10680 [Candidatus Omnitrophica bacterium]|nr:hypothetical protein [Candidatus Omnitrophota bacterium]MDD5672093.1 hypothetical protein [Candidatus Omnitrophota bacterium]
MAGGQINTSLEVKRFESVRNFDQNHWDVLFPQAHESYAFHQTLEEVLTRQLKFYYFGIYAKTKLIGVAPCFMMDDAFDATFAGPLKAWTAIIRKIMPRFLRPRILFCGSPAGEGTLGIDRR